jgi:Plasma-membrane choline transporter
MFVKANASGNDGVPLAIVGVEPVSIDEDSSGIVNDNGRRHYGSVPIATPLIGMPSEAHNSFEDAMIVNKETPRFRDLPFLILYLVHLAIMIFLALDYGSFTTIDKMDYNVSNWRNLVDDDKIANDQEWEQFESLVSEAERWIAVYPPRILKYIIVPSAFVAYAISYVWTAVIIPSCPTAVVVSALLGSLALSITLTIAISVVSGFNIFALLFGFLMMACVGYYLKLVWRLIPFAAVNLSVALQGISANCGMYLVALAFSIVGFLWTLFWVYVVVGVMQAMDKSYETQHPRPEDMSRKDYANTEQDDPLRGFVFLAFLLSLYWTTQILLVRCFFALVFLC